MSEYGYKICIHPNPILLNVIESAGKIIVKLCKLFVIQHTIIYDELTHGFTFLYELHIRIVIGEIVHLRVEVIKLYLPLGFVIQPKATAFIS